MTEIIEINKYLEELNIIDISNCVIFNDCVRDKQNKNLKNYNIKAYICKTSNVIFLKYMIKDTNYYQNQNKDYWTWDNYNLLYDFNRRFKYIEKYIRNKIWLDFGTGLGKMLLNSPKIYKKIYGVEINEYCLKYLKNKNVIIENNINNIEENVDIITLFHVLEHFNNPIKILNDIHNKLNNNGLVIIEVPHSNDFMLKNINNKKYKDFILWNEHLVLHNEHSIKKLLNYCNFEIIKFDYIQRYPISNHLYWCNDGKPNGHNKLLLLNDESLISSYENVLKKEKVTDTIILICKKKK